MVKTTNNLHLACCEGRVIAVILLEKSVMQILLKKLEVYFNFSDSVFLLNENNRSIRSQTVFVNINWWSLNAVPAGVPL